MNIRLCCGMALVVFALPAVRLRAGGSGLNVIVVVNQDSTNSVQLGNYYCERRQVPPQNLLRIDWPGTNTVWTRSDFETYLLDPLTAMLADRELTNQADYVVLSMDIPYVVTDTNGVNSTTAALFYGFKSDDCTSDCPAGIPGCNLPIASSNAYAASESIFRQMPPIAPGSNSWLVTMITAENLALAEAIIDHGVAGDGAFPTQIVWLAKTSDTARNVRFLEFDNAIFDARVDGDFSILRTNLDSPYGLTNLGGLQTGLQVFSILPNAFVPGAIADSLTSFGGLILQPNGQTTALALLAAGASGSYGTVTEPCNYLEKFPSPQDYFYQARGFSLAECYYQSLMNPYQGLMLAEPLSAPFARPPTGAWTNLSSDSVLSGVTNLALACAAGGPGRLVQQVDLFLDGTWLETLTNIPPAAGNRIYVSVNGAVTNYTVPADATIKSVAAGLADALNQPGYASASEATATAIGDRIVVRFADVATPGADVPASVSNAVGSASALTTLVTPAGGNFLDTVAFGLDQLWASNAPAVGDYLQLAVTKTNGTQIAIAVTNTAPGTNMSGLTQELVDAINSNSGLQAADGLAAEDFLPYDGYGLPFAQFNLRARTAGWPAAQIQVNFSGSPDLALSPVGAQTMDQNRSDLEPRDHFYVTAGVTNLALAFPLDTTALADGYHELTAVAYEGSSVHTEARLTQDVIVSNTPLSATFTTLAGASNTVLNFTLLFSVVANTNAISRIELFSTGGSVGVVSNQAAATFAVAGTNLGVGRHPFYAVVTRTDGKQYRTATRWIRLGAAQPEFGVTLTAPPPALAWPATAGQLYEILSATNLTDPFLLRATVTPSNSPGIWIDLLTGATQQFYRVRTP